MGERVTHPSHAIKCGNGEGNAATAARIPCSGAVACRFYSECCSRIAVRCSTAVKAKPSRLLLPAALSTLLPIGHFPAVSLGFLPVFARLFDGLAIAPIEQINNADVSLQLFA